MSAYDLLVIDPQNDFLDIPGAALPVSGANADMQRLADWLMGHLPQAFLQRARVRGVQTLALAELD